MRLYMEVETAQQSVSRLLDSALQWQAELFRLRQSLSQLTGSWQGPSADAFFLNADGLLGALTEAGHHLETLAQQGRREIEQWVQAAAYLEGQTHPVIDLTEEDLAIWGCWAVDTDGFGGRRAGFRGSRAGGFLRAPVCPTSG